MNWKDSMREWGGGEVSFLSEDGECVVFVVCGEPVLLESMFKKKKTERIGAPVMTEDGFSLLVMGKRLARRLSKHEENFGSHAFIAVRHGDQGDINTRYELTVLDDIERTTKLFQMVAEGIPADTINEAVASAIDIMSS